MLTTRTPNLQRILKYFGGPLLLLVSWDLLVVVTVKQLNWTWVSVEGIPLAMYGSVLGIVVGFRNNCAYARWWEARILWGRIVEGSRNLARQVSGLSQDGPDGGVLARRVIHHQIAYVHALRQTLRGEPLHLNMTSPQYPRRAGTADAGIQHSQRLAVANCELVKQARRQQWFHVLDWHVMERTLGGHRECTRRVERLKNTPLPRQYDFFVMLFVQTYCLLLPLGNGLDVGMAYTPGIHSCQLHVSRAGTASAAA